MSSPKIERVYSNADVAKVFFVDGHTATFAANRGGWSQPTSIERFWLERGPETVAMFHSGLQSPVNYTPFGFVTIARGYTVIHVVRYWQAAQNHVGTAGWGSSLEMAWRIIRMGAVDLGEIKDGKWPAPTTS